MEVIIATGYASTETAVLALNERASAYIIKPFRKDELLNKARDILERQRLVREKRQAEEALRESEQLNFNLIEQSPHPILITKGEDSTIIRVNPALERLTGYSASELVGAGAPYPWWTDQMEENKFDRDKQSARERREQRFEERFRKKNGELFWVEITPTTAVFIGNRMKYLFSTWTDITERKRAEERIANLNSVLRAIRDVNQLITHENDRQKLIQKSCDLLLKSRAYAGAWILLVDAAGNFLSAASAGHDKEMPLLIELFKKGDYPRCVEEVLQKKKFVTYTRLKESHQGCPMASIPIGQSVFGHRLESGGKVYGMMVASVLPEVAADREEQELFQELASDISYALGSIERAEEHEQAERKAREVETLKELDRLRNQLIANISHELRTPLASIKGFATTLLQTDVKWSVKEQREFLEAIDQETDRLTRLISDLLDISRLESGMLKLVKSSYQISEILASVNDRLTSLTEYHPLQVVVPKNLPPLHVDEMRIGQILTNLVENATKFSQKGSPITIKAEPSGKWVTLSVIDQGVGIPPELLDKIFDRFYQTDNIVTGRKTGTGLGLSICRGIVAAHGGKMWVESKVGDGSKFSFTLPVSKERKVAQGAGH